MLIVLIMSHNQLTYLPQSVKNIKHLIFLDVSNNNLLYLPATISQLNIYYANISRNWFPIQTSYVSNLKMPKLTELSAKIIINQRFVASFSCTSVLLFVYFIHRSIQNINQNDESNFL